MPSFSKRLNRGQFLVSVKIVKSQSGSQPSRLLETLVKSPPKQALLDTGATTTCISHECVDELDLSPIGMTEIQTATDRRQVSQYLIAFAIPVTKTAVKETKKQDGNKGFETVFAGQENWAHIRHKVNELPPLGEGRGFDMILGMDILSQTHITMFGGNLIMSF